MLLWVRPVYRDLEDEGRSIDTLLSLVLGRKISIGGDVQWEKYTRASRIGTNEEDGVRCRWILDTFLFT